MTLKYATKSLTRRKLWCGPFALAMLSGVDYDTAYAKALVVKKRRLNAVAKSRGWPAGHYPVKPIKGMHPAELICTGERMGVRFGTLHEHGVGIGATLLTFTRDHTVAGRVYLVAAGNHFMIVQDGVLYHAHHAPMPVDDAPKYRRAIITDWVEVRPTAAALQRPDGGPVAEEQANGAIGYRGPCPGLPEHANGHSVA